jgi:hypothetical protein
MYHRANAPGVLRRAQVILILTDEVGGFHVQAPDRLRNFRIRQGYLINTPCIRGGPLWPVY